MSPAFVVIDVQRRFEHRMQHPPLGDAVEVITRVASLFRAAGHPVVWVYDDERGAKGTPGFELVEGLAPHADDVRHHKTAANAFKTLTVRGCDFFLLAGFKADGCVLASAMGAQDRDLPFAVLRGGLIDSTRQSVAFIDALLPVVSHEVVTAMLR
ncbi:MAG: cysteine hydrolase family protein [Sandaracinaceae bacterium]